MKSIKYIFIALVLTGFTASVSAQKIWWTPTDVDPNAPLTVYIDLDQMTCTNLASYLNPGDNLYLWTWKPANNTLDLGAWNASNDADPKLKWVKVTDPNVGPNVWKLEMLPSVKEFYGVSAQKVYDDDISLLAKAYDGGSGGDCTNAGGEHKTEDLTIPVTPAFIPPPKVESHPTRYYYNNTSGDLVQTDTVFSDQDDVFRITYNHNVGVETDSAALTWTGFKLWAKATMVDLSTSIPVSFANLATTPSALMQDPDGNGIFEYTIIPSQFFNIPSGMRIAKMSFLIYKDGAANISETIQFPPGDRQFDYIFSVP